MMWLLAILGSLGGAGVLVWASRHRRLRAQKRYRMEGIDTLRHLKQLLVLIQQHRGLSNGQLNGDAGIALRVQRVAIEADRIWLMLEQSDSEWALNERFIGVSTHWQRLKCRYSGLSISNNLEQHNRLILNLRYLMEEVAETYQLEALGGGVEKVDVIWKELLEAAECVGQLRALGTGIVVAGGSDSVQRIRVKFLNEKIQQMLETLALRLSLESPVEQVDALMHRLLGQVNQARQPILELTQLSRRELYKERDIAISGDDYFDLACRGMEPLLQAYDESLDQLQKCV